MLLDRYGRQITYLRVSVTDRCNMRCVYCMPPEGIQLQSHAAVMRYEEIAEVVRAAASQGIREVRLTGGEPLVRLDLAELVRLIAEIPGIEDISLTTTGLLLGKYARSLADAGLRRVNVSLDTLRPDRFTRITRGADLSQVWQGLTAAEAAGLKPIKLNVVVMRGVNSDELIDLAQLTLEHDWHVRFIELMPVQNQSAWGQDFRVDYLYIGKFIEQLQQKKQNNRKIPVSCFTATARPQVIADIKEYFNEFLGLKLQTFTAGCRRNNLHFRAIAAETELDK